jgi:hypothetical protein
MSQTSKMILVAIVAAILSGGGIYLWQMDKSPELPPVSTQGQAESETVVSSTEGAAKYNCVLSGGSFKNGFCECPIEEELGQTQDTMYDKNTGFCQTTYGGPGGNAFAASIGLPYGDYAFYNNIVQNNCKETGGEFLYVCNCTNGKSYNKTTGYCK